MRTQSAVVVIGAIYSHYKGSKKVRVESIAVHSETKEELVITTTLDGSNYREARPMNDFLSTVKVIDHLAPRYLIVSSEN